MNPTLQFELQTQILIAHQFHKDYKEPLCKLCREEKLTDEHMDKCSGCALCEE